MNNFRAFSALDLMAQMIIKNQNLSKNDLGHFPKYSHHPNQDLDQYHQVLIPLKMLCYFISIYWPSLSTKVLDDRSQYCFQMFVWDCGLWWYWYQIFLGP